MTDRLHQINVQYRSKEDRILLRTSTENNEEYLIWLTRRFTRILMDILDKEIEKRGGTTGLGAKKETKKMFNEGAFEKPYKEKQDKERPLGDEGILAFGIKAGTDQNGNFSLNIQSESGKGITYNLNDALIYMFYSLLVQAIERADWGLDKFAPRKANTRLH